MAARMALVLSFGEPPLSTPPSWGWRHDAIVSVRTACQVGHACGCLAVLHGLTGADDGAGRIGVASSHGLPVGLVAHLYGLLHRLIEPALLRLHPGRRGAGAHAAVQDI